MSVAVLLAELRRHGIELIAEGGRLRYRAPRGAMTPELRGSITTLRVELLANLAEGRRPAPPDSASCQTCGSRRLRANLTEHEGRLSCPECLYRCYEEALNRRRRIAAGGGEQPQGPVDA